MHAITGRILALFSVVMKCTLTCGFPSSDPMRQNLSVVCAHLLGIRLSSGLLLSASQGRYRGTFILGPIELSQGFSQRQSLLVKKYRVGQDLLWGAW